MMNYFAIQVKTREEADILKRLDYTIAPERVTFIFPRKVMKIRKRGVFKNRETPVFPGYLFLALETGEKCKIDPDLYFMIKKTSGVFRFLKNNQDIRALSGRDRDLLLHFMSSGERADISKVTFDENDRIMVLEGPLKGLEALIVRVDKRKCRAKVQLSMCENPFLIDLAFDVMERFVGGIDENSGTERVE